VDLPKEEVDWSSYFAKIKTVCPWSHKAFVKDQIQVIEWTGTPRVLGSAEAIVYTCDLSARQLKVLANKFNQQDDDCEWLWSHPKGGGENSTPVACLIQQDRRKLHELRNKL